MKKLFLIILSIFIVNNLAARAWYETAIIDAGGALGGAGSVSSLCPPCLGVPIGQAAIVGGAIIGGAAASLAIYPQEPTGPNSWNQNNHLFIDLTTLNSIGYKHNEIVTNFNETNSQFTVEDYKDFINNNHEDYTLQMNYENFQLNPSYILSDLKINEINSNMSLDEVMSTILSENDLEFVNEFKEYISNFESYQSFKNDNHSFYHDKLNNSNDELTTIKLKVFYSIFVYSAHLNNE